MPTQYYVMGFIAILIGLVFSLGQIVRHYDGQNRTSKLLVNGAGNLIVGWATYVMAIEYGVSLHVAGYAAAAATALGMSVISLTLLAIILIIESKYDIKIPPNAKRWVEDLTQ